MYGWTGKILRVDLSNREVNVENKDESFYRSFVGGSNIIAYYLLNELPANIDAFDEDNLIVISTSVYTGTIMPGSGRFSVGCKSPLTGGIADSQAGGFWGPELKFAGYDAIVISGKADNPCYIWINNDHVEICDGSNIWGKTTGDVEDIIREELNEPKCKILQTGIAGERLVRYAAVTDGLMHWCGRGGTGAVMGSKNLRAIVVRGTNRVPVYNSEKMNEFAKWFSIVHKENDGIVFKKKYGTIGGLESMDAQGLLPTYNFRKGSLENAESIGGINLYDTLLVKSAGCYACPIKCKRVVGYKGDDFEIEERYGGPEYESAGSLASNCGITSQKHSCKANELCAKYGLDSISTGVTISFAMECFKRGLITKEDTGGLELSFSDGDVLLEIIRMIAYREGIGDLLAEGSWRAAQKIGGGAESFSMTTKKQELPAHDPRGKWGVALGYAISPTGADHLISAHDPWFAIEPNTEKQYTNMDILPMRYFGIFEPIPAMSLSSKKLRLFMHLQYLWSLYDVLDLCIFVGVPEYRMISIEQLVDVVNYITGWDMSTWEAIKIGEKAIQLSRMFNIKHGLSAKDDVLPNRLFEPLENGAHEGHAIDRDAFNNAVHRYYEMMGWDQYGKPTKGKFIELGIEDLYIE